MSPGSNTESYPAFAHIGLRENPGKTLNQVTCPDREPNPGLLVSQLDLLTSVSWEAGGKKTFGEDNIKVDLREMGYDDRDWINLARDRDRWRAYLCEDGNESPGSLEAICKYVNAEFI
ncbi:hypothetical protein ANN_09437 [Periplaneta americana]|uniref:Uncharacterized protein n=1 Tax=Periplaneta americana TaxID=6978 RepID=A0ABQ8TLD6_PERAM|nr:hypothetical protein ANN_09437 [Periplaneta americana]